MVESTQQEAVVELGDEVAPNFEEKGDEVIQVQDLLDATESYDHETAVKLTMQPDKNLPCGPNSFSDCRDEYNPETPAPLYFDAQFLKKPLPNEKEIILHGLEQRADTNLICVDKEAIERQNGVLGAVAKQVAANFMKGLSISHISLPIKIFEPRSTINRIIDTWSQTPHFLAKAAEAVNDPLERLKWTITSALSTLYLCTGQDKPFNPLLGETSQTTFPDGTRIYCEHTSHHPPITSFLVEKDGPQGYTMHGYYEIHGKMGANSLLSGLRGPTTLTFNEGGTKIIFNAPDFQLGGTIMGDRTIEFKSSLVFCDVTNDLKGVVVLSTYKQTGTFKKTTTGSKTSLEGIIFKIDDLASKVPKFGKDQKLPDELKDVKEAKDIISKVSGSWLSEIRFDDKIYWDINETLPVRQIPYVPDAQQLKEGPGIVLPSDWRYREDLIWLKYGFMEIASNWKIKLEVQQRKDRKNRMEAEKAKKEKK